MSVEVRSLVVCAAFAVGEVAGALSASVPPLGPAAAVTALLVALFGYGGAVRLWPPVCAVFVGFALAMNAAAERERVLDATVRLASARPATVSVKVTGEGEARTGRDGGTWRSFPGTVGPVKVRVIWAAPASAPGPLAGETWLCTGWMSREAPRHANAGRLFWVRGKGTGARRIRARGVFAAVFWRLRRELSRRVGLGLGHDPETAALNRAILLGERARLDPRVRDDFIAAGTVHIFAISGLHVMIVVRVLLVLFVLPGIPYRVARLVVVPAVWLYTGVIGFPPSAIRAATMASIDAFAPTCWRRPNGILAWAFTFLAVYAADPGRLDDVGCGLSFTVMLAIVLWGRAAARARLDGWRAGLGLTAVTWAAGVPIAAHVFGRITPGGLVANLIVVPVASWSVVSGVLGVLASFLSSSVAAHLNNAAALLTRSLRGISQALASLPGASIEVAPWSLAACAAWYAVFVVSAAVFLPRRKDLCYTMNIEASGRGR